MRRLLTLLALLATGIYGSGHLLLNESSVNALLGQMDGLSAQGDVHGVCGLFDDDIVVALDDRTPENPLQLNGGKTELCTYLAQVLPLQHKFVAASQIERHQFTLVRDWLHPWTVQASYNEHRVDTMKQLDARLPPHSAMRSRDQLTVIMTLRGRRIARLASISEALAPPDVDDNTSAQTISATI